MGFMLLPTQVLALPPTSQVIFQVPKASLCCPDQSFAFTATCLALQRPSGSFCRWQVYVICLFLHFQRHNSSVFHRIKNSEINMLMSYFSQRLKSLCTPAEEWHPYLDIHRGERYSEERCRRTKHTNKPEVHVNVISSSWL